MKKLLVVLLSLAASLLAADYSGIWNGKGGIESAKYGSVPQTAQLTLLQAGSSVSGTLKIGNGAIMKIASGAVSGSTITFAVGGGTGTLTQSGAQLKGRLTSSKGEILDIVFTH
jgi:diacylglycerol kinase family enzyme